MLFCVFVPCFLDDEVDFSRRKLTDIYGRYNKLAGKFHFLLQCLMFPDSFFLFVFNTVFSLRSVLFHSAELICVIYNFLFYVMVFISLYIKLNAI